ncbi:MAG TPA: (5-formylfuran-3-yl)methyl phosphate synthase [Pirellulales bacterium]|nr:(5-formylfuran-3-yl)methyl phosphate synthase [Pirellulales bacterium]
MTRLLVSVRSVEEARIALDARVDLIDFKEPRRGSLGAVDASTAAEIIQAIGGRAPLSMACGELLSSASDVGQASAGSSPSGRGWVRAEASSSTAADLRMKPAQTPGSWGIAALCRQPPPGVSYAKLGLAGCATIADWPRRWADWIAGLPAGAAPVAVAYADWQAVEAPPPGEVLEHAAGLGCRAVLVDTFDKSGGDLLRHLSIEELSRFVQDVRGRRLLSVLAGSLSWENLPRVLEAQPDYVAVRGAVCSGPREAALDGGLVRQWVERLHGRSGIVADRGY